VPRYLIPGFYVARIPIAEFPVAEIKKNQCCFAEPDRQFLLVQEHIHKIRQDLYRTLSKVYIYVERNLGFESEHHHHSLGDIPGVEFYMVRFVLHRMHFFVHTHHVNQRQQPEKLKDRLYAHVRPLLIEVVPNDCSSK
jgi:hypothetical protein